MTQQRRLVVTAALPYANGDIHLGHLVEYTQADIWVRFQKMRGASCLYLCGSDAHGTPVMLAAKKKGVLPEDMVTEVQVRHEQDFQDCLIEFDHFYTTHSPENEALIGLVYERLQKRDDITKRSVLQAYDEVAGMFLPDRFVRGECPRCGAEDQYGDNCEVCGATYSPTDLKNARSVLSDHPPIQKKSTHYFFELSRYEKWLQSWLQSGVVPDAVVNKMKEWFDTGLKAWDISRDAPYFGFHIPGTTDKYFYVWMDAPLGYIACFQHLAAERSDLNFDDYWGQTSTVELVHFIGKDVMYFHTLFWPAILKGAGFRVPSRVAVHGYLTINGEKMSKSRGTFITARDYLSHLPAECLRYYYAAKLSAQIEDIDLNWEDFRLRVNSDIVGKFVNLASRCAGFITKGFDGQLADTLPDEALFHECVDKGEELAAHYEATNFHHVMREVMLLCDRANQYIDHHKPWVLNKDPEQAPMVQAICTQGLNLFKVLMTYLKPVLPRMAEQVEDFFQCDPLMWDTRGAPYCGCQIKPFQPLCARIQPEHIDALKEAVESRRVKEQASS